MTSAGIFTPDGRLVRTLWGNQRLPAGKNVREWDGKDDDGNPVSDGPFKFKLLTHNLEITWEGTIGNSSDYKTGSEKLRGYGVDSIVDIACAPGADYLLRGYDEDYEQVSRFSPDHPNRFQRSGTTTTFFRAGNPTYFGLSMAVDNDRVYLGFGRNKQYGDNLNAFVTAYGRGGSETPYVFTAVSPAPGITTGANHSGNWIVTGTGTGANDNAPIALAVQTNGSRLAVNEGGRRIAFFDKLSGASLDANLPPIDVQGATAIRWSSDERSLWIASGQDVQNWLLAGGTWSKGADITTGQPVRTIAVNPKDGSIGVLYGGTLQQLRVYSPTGSQMYAIGHQGGYADGPDVAPDKFMFEPNMPVPTPSGVGLAFEPDGSVWIVDNGNQRLVKFSPDHQFLDQISLVTSYVCTADPNNPSRVFAGYREFSRDWKKPLGTGPDPGWKLERNWAYGFAYQGASGYTNEGLNNVVTATNGHTYGFLVSPPNPFPRVVELTKTGLRVIGNAPDPKPYLAANLDVWSIKVDPKAGIDTFIRRKITGFKDVDPIWSDPETYATAPLQPNLPSYGGGYHLFGGPPVDPWPDGTILSANTTVPGKAGTYCLGFVRQGANDFFIKTAKEVVGGPLPRDGSVPIDPWNAPSNIATIGNRRIGDLIAIFCNGEFYDQGEANQILFYHRSGLPLAAFGTRFKVGLDYAPSSGKSGNFYGNAFVEAPDGSVHLIHSDESSHGGIHEIRIARLDSIQVAEADLSLGSSADLGTVQVKGDPPADEFSGKGPLIDSRGATDSRWEDPAGKFASQGGHLSAKGSASDLGAKAVLLRPDEISDSLQTLEIPSDSFDPSHTYTNPSVSAASWGLVSRAQSDGSRFFAIVEYVRFSAEAQKQSPITNGTLNVTLGMYIGDHKFVLAFDNCYFLPPPGQLHNYRLSLRTEGSSPTRLHLVLFDESTNKDAVILDSVCDQRQLQEKGRVGLTSQRAPSVFGDYRLVQGP